ncbi:MAG: glycosyltransferase, partial [Candidatus Parcubacteria bacterium]|nr:glycosyltransferase [Candidatus Parcubacteria bacterium]
GPELNKLKKVANKNIEFLGLVSDEKLARLYSNAQACIFPQEEDFGIVPLESMASGRPVIAYRAGGAVETIVENKTGIFFNEQTPESLQAAIEKFHNLYFKPENCREQAEKFDVGIFKEKIFRLIGEVGTGSNKI